MIQQLVRFVLRKQKALYQRLWWYSHKGLFGSLGKNVIVIYPCDLTFQNIHLGDRVIIDVNAVIWCTDSKVYFGDYSGAGPNLTIIGGNHNMSIVGSYFLDVIQKLPENDLDVYIEEDVWIGANVTILKGVRIGRGAIIGACSVVTKSIPRYAVAVGNPASVIKYRFNAEEIKEHERMLKLK